MLMFRNEGGCLFPENDEAKQLMAGFKDGHSMQVKLTYQKKAKMLARFYKIREFTFSKQTKFSDLESWGDNLLVIAGHFAEVQTERPDWLDGAVNYFKASDIDGDVIRRLEYYVTRKKRAKSVALDKVSEKDLRDIVHSIITGFCKYYPDSLSESELETFIRLGTV